MNKKIIMTILLLLAVIISISAVNAGENITQESNSASEGEVEMPTEKLDIASDDNDNAEPADNENYNARIIAENTTHEYRPYMGNEIWFLLKDSDGNPIRNANPTATYDNKKISVFYDDENHYGKGWGTYILDVNPQFGNHEIKVELNTTKYLAKPVSFNVNITKISAKLTLSKYVTTTKEYAVLKAKVKDKNGGSAFEGKVKFKVNGKTFTVKVKNGVAKMKIKLKKAKNYKYKATFLNDNYKTNTASSTLYIKKAKKYYTLKIRNYEVKLPYKKYVKVLNGKNKGKLGYADVSTGIRRPPEYGGGYYYVGISTNDEYHTYYGYEMHDYLFLRASNYLQLKKINLYTANF